MLTSRLPTRSGLRPHHEGDQYLTITRTAKRTKTVTTIAPTSTATTTITEVSTTTLTPVRASTTITITTSTTITQTIVEPSTITTFITQTIEVSASASTYYAACSPNNIVTQINGQGISALEVPNLSPNFFPIGSAYEWCAACISTTACVGSAFTTNPNSCITLTRNSGACDPNSQGARPVLTGATSDGSVSLSNGICGKYYL